MSEKRIIQNIIQRFKLDKNIINDLKNMTPKFGFNGLGELVFRRTYSRNNEDWADVVIRVIEGCMTIRKEHFHRSSLMWNDLEWQSFARNMAISLFNMEWLPPGRGLWMMGTEYAYTRGSMALNNCGACDTKDDFVLAAEWTMDALMNGVGVGFTTNWRGTVNMPDKNDTQLYIISDSREGWVESLIRLMCSYINSPRYGTNKFPKFDYSQIRESGQPIKSFGGLSSGPEPLKQLHKRVEEFLDSFYIGRLKCKSKTWKKLKNNNGEAVWREVEVKVDKPYSHTRLVADIINSIGACVVAGNVRRSAEICLGSVDDEDFINLKNYEMNPERGEIGWLSNNSVVLKADKEYEDFSYIPKMANRIRDNGEPGMINLYNIQKYGRFGKVSHDKASLVNPCFSGDTLIAVADGRKAVRISELAKSGKDVPMYSIDQITREVSIQWGRNPRITGTNRKLIRIYFKRNVEEEYMDVTPNHKFLLQDGSIVDAQYLQSGDSLPRFKHTIPSDKKEYIYSNNKKMDIKCMYNKFYKSYPNIIMNNENRIPTNDHYIIKNNFMIGEKRKRYEMETGHIPHNMDKLAYIELKEYYDHIQDSYPGINFIRTSEIELKIMKKCEKCYGIFFTDWFKREVGYCSHACSNNGTDTCHIQSISSSYQNFVNQTKIYLDLSNRFPYYVSENAFREECKKNNISPNFTNSKKSKEWTPTCWSNFQNMVKNNIYEVIRVEELPDTHNVYNITVENNHTLAVITKKNESLVTGIFTFNCGEIPLESYELCNLSEVFPPRCNNQAIFNKALEYATFYASTVSLLPTNRPETNAVIARNRRIGVSISGIAQWVSGAVSKDWGIMNYTCMGKYLRDGYKIVKDTNIKLAKDAGVPESIRVTTVKPSGSISLLAGVTPGVHFPVSRYAIRRVRISKNSPLIEPLISAGVPHEDDKVSQNTYVFEFVIDHGDVRSCEKVSPWEQFSLVQTMQKHYADNCVSATIYFDKEKDGPDIEKMLAMFIPNLKSISMLPHAGHGYAQAPYEPISFEEYKKRLNAFKYPTYEKVQNNTPVGSKFCSGDKCEL